MNISALRASAIVAATVIMLMMPAFFAHAQTTADDTLRATVKSEILADPRSKNLTSAQIQAMVILLAQQAQKQNVSAHDLAWHPYQPQESVLVGNYDCSEGFFCNVNTAFGFSGRDMTIPIWLFVVSALFIFIFSLMREMGHPHTQFVSTETAPKDTI